MHKKLIFKAHAVRTLSSPYRDRKQPEEPTETIYYLLVNMKDLPDDIPMEVNPRVPKMGTNVAKKLIHAVEEPETDFYLNNRGIVISAKAFKFNPTDSEVIIDLGDQDSENDRFLYGILDGGHTYTAIIQHRNAIPKDIEKYVRLEIVTNVANITRLSDARNTSVQVSDIALFNLEDKFDYVQKAIENEPYKDFIAYKDNEDKPISVSELLRLMFAFDIDRYPDDKSAPIQSYSGKAQVFKRYKEAYSSPFYLSLTNQLPLLVELFDTIERDLGNKYCDYKRSQGIKTPHFGSVKGVEIAPSDHKSTFLFKDMPYIISSGYIFPIFGAFRALLKYDASKGEVYWLFDPLETWDEIGATIAQNTFDSSSNPQLAGKDKPLWQSNYRIVETQSLRKLLENR